MVSAIVVAAGFSSRMGDAHKMLLPFGEGLVVTHTVKQVMASGAGEVIVVTGHKAEAVEEALAFLPVKVVRNEDYASGLSSSLKAGIEAANGNSYMLCLADMVSIEPAEYAQLINTFESAGDADLIVLPRFQGQKGNPVIFSSSYRDELLAHGAKEGFKELVQAHRDKVLWVDMLTGHVLQDMDEWSDYERLKNGA